MFADARKRLIKSGFGFRAINAQQIPYADVTFDTVAAHLKPYHVPDRVRAIAEIRRVLKPNGRLFAITLGYHYMREPHELLRLVGVNYRSKHDLASEPFSQESREQQYATSFGVVTLIPFECYLTVTDAQPPINDVRSMNTAGTMLTDEQAQRLGSQVRGIIDMNGSFISRKIQGYSLHKHTQENNV